VRDQEEEDDNESPPLIEEVWAKLGWVEKRWASDGLWKERWVGRKSMLEEEMQTRLEG
jgi:hypothetical protein